MRKRFLHIMKFKSIVRNTFVWILLFFGFGLVNSFAQDFCGTKSPDPEAKRLFVEQLEKVASKAKNARIGQTTGTIEWVAVKPWIIKLGNDKAIEEADVNKLIAIVNKDYLAADIQFFIREFGYITSQTDNQYWNMCRSDIDNSILLNEYSETEYTHSNSSINLYFINGIRNKIANEMSGCNTYVGNEAGETLGIAPNSIDLYNNKNFPNGNNIFNNRFYNAVYVIGKTSNNGSEKTLSHELGHYFNLFHTFTDNLISCEERAENSNNFGDMVSDTPVDPYSMWIKKMIILIL